MQVCTSITEFQGKCVLFPSETNPTIKYKVWTGELGKSAPTCDCPSYKYQQGTDHHGACKHVRAVLENVCGWGERWSDEKQNSRQQRYGLCPKCGRKTTEERNVAAQA